MTVRVGHGFDAHRFEDAADAPDLTIKLGGVPVPATKRIVAHSDGDVVIHAICDALFGALAIGDIGSHFPDTDERYRGIDSRELLRRAAASLKNEGYVVVNLDVTLVLQRPRVAPYVDSMRDALAADLVTDRSCISVKATTTEGMGFVGREEGVAAFAVVLIESL